MALQESGEMYLETILILSRQKGFVRSVDISEHMGYSKPSVSRAVGLSQPSLPIKSRGMRSIPLGIINCTNISSPISPTRNMGNGTAIFTATVPFRTSRRVRFGKDLITCSVA